MKRKIWVMIATAVAAVFLVAAAPAEGTVIEGQSVPGLALGDSRAQAEAAYGDPQWCQSAQTAGDNGSCSFPVEGGGQVDVLYRGADGGNASNSPDDVVFNVRWTEPVSGWTTTAGVSTTLAAENPQAVIEAYPDAVVTYNMFGGIYSVIDYQQGIQVYWFPDFYTGQVHIGMAISYPTNPPPPQEQLTRVTEIDLAIGKGRDKRTITALVRVQDETGQAADGASVLAHWLFPNGTTQTVEASTSSAGWAYFDLRRVPRGAYTLVIDDVLLEDHQFDSENSVLSASIQVR